MDDVHQAKKRKYLPDLNLSDPRFNLYDVHSPTSIYSLAPECIKETILECYTRMPKLLIYPERRIRDILKPNERDDRIRMSFWDEYNRVSALAIPKPMALRNIINTVITPSIFEQEYAHNRHRVAWLITPIRSYAHSMQLILTRSLDKLMDVVEKDITKPDGTLDHKLITQIIKIAQITDLRVKGAIPQYLRVDQRSMNVNVDADQMRLNKVSNDFEQLLSLPLDELERMREKSERLVERCDSYPEAEIIEAEAENRDNYMLNNVDVDIKR